MDWKINPLNFLLSPSGQALSWALVSWAPEEQRQAEPLSSRSVRDRQTRVAEKALWEKRAGR